MLKLDASEAVALDLDLVCALRLERHDNERDRNRLESLIRSQTLMIGSFFGVDPAEIRAAFEESDN